MTAHEVHEYRRRLEGLIAHLSGTTSQLEAEVRGAAGGPNGPLETGEPVDLGAGEVAIQVLGTEAFVLGEATDALARIDRGTFGRCEACRQPIPRARLDALPYARYCVGCARQVESGRARN